MQTENKYNNNIIISQKEDISSDMEPDLDDYDIDKGIMADGMVKTITISTFIVDQNITEIDTLKRLLDIQYTDDDLKQVIELIKVVIKPQITHKNLPRWLIPIIKNKSVTKEIDKKTEPTVSKLKVLNDTSINHLENLKNATELFTPIDINEEHGLSLTSTEIFKDAVDYNFYHNTSLLSTYKIKSDATQCIYKYEDALTAQINKKKYNGLLYIRVYNDDIISRKQIILKKNIYNVDSYIKVPFDYTYLKSKQLSKLGKCKPLNKSKKDTGKYCIITNSLDKIKKQAIKHLILNNKVKNYAELYTLFKKYDLDPNEITGKIYNKMIYNKSSGITYQPLFFFGYYIQPENNIFISADKGMSFYAEQQQIHNSHKTLKSIIETKLNTATKLLEHEHAESIDLSDMSLNIIKINKEKIIYTGKLFIENDGAIIPFNNYVTLKRIELLTNLLSHIITSSLLYIDPVKAHRKLQMNIMLNNKYKNNGIIIPTPLVLPSRYFCKIRSIRKYRDIYYLNRLFIIDYSDQCILIETGEHLWCKHEIYSIEECSKEFEGVTLCKYCSAIFKEKIDTSTGFTSNGQPNQVQSGNLYHEINPIYLIIENILNSFIKISDHSKSTIRIILENYYTEHGKKQELVTMKSITGIECYNMLEHTLRRYKTVVKNLQNIGIDPEFNISAENILDNDSIKKFYALDYFYMFADIVSKMMICYEIITKIPQNIQAVIKKFERVWNISKLDLEKKYNFNYFYDRYAGLNKEEYLVSYAKKFQGDKKLNNIRDTNQASGITSIQQYLSNKLILTECKSTLSYNQALAQEYIKSIADKLGGVSEFVNKFVLKKVVFANQTYEIKDYTVEEFDMLNRAERNAVWYVDPSNCITGLLLNGKDSIIYQNPAFFNQDKLDIDYRINTEYRSNLDSIFDDMHLIVDDHDINYKIIPPRTKAMKVNQIKREFSIVPMLDMTSHKPFNILTKSQKRHNSDTITKSLSIFLINDIYLNKNIDIMIDFLNSIKINLTSDNKKHTRSIGFGDFLTNMPGIKQRKIELNAKWNDVTDKHESAPHHDLSLYSHNILDDIKSISSIVQLDVAKRLHNAVNPITINSHLDESIITQNNHNMVLNNIYTSFYKTFKYLSALSMNHDVNFIIDDVHNVDFAKLKVLFSKYNIKRYNNNNDIYSITNKNLKKIYKKFNIKKLTVKKDVIADTFNVFNNIVYRNALIIELYQYVIAAIGVTDKSVSFIDINSIAAENKAHIEKIKDVYRKLFEYLYHTSQIINPLNTTFEIIDAANGMKNIKKLIAKYDTQPIDQFIYGEDVEIQKPSAYINEEENDGDDENYDYDDNDEENYDIVDGDGNLPDDDYEPEPDISLDEEYADEVILDEIVEI